MSKQATILEMIRLLDKVKQLPLMEGSVECEKRNN